jgi:hypothetical protein
MPPKKTGRTVHRLYRDLPHLIGRAPEELDWQRLAIDEFFRDDSPDDAVYDSV